jgi:serine/threonine protein kinase
MSPQGSPHPPPDHLAAYGLLLLNPEQADAVRRHLADCRTCRALLEVLPEHALLPLAATRVPLRPREGQTMVHSWERQRASPKPGTAVPRTGQPTAAAPSGNASVSPDRAVAVPMVLTNHPRYEILGVLGSGGMGVVYQARHRLMNRVVALKVIHPRLVDQPEMALRFRGEAQAAARLSHPNIVTAFDAEQAGATHFLVLQYVEGRDLQCVLRQRGRLPVAAACDCARQTALGLQHAHERGMVHRDIKPHNLMLTPEGVVKILDFGLARFASETASEFESGGWTGGDCDLWTPAPGEAPTRANAVLGTPDYLAPEEARCTRQADIRADIYSLGCTLYALVTGRVPFPASSLEDKLAAHALATATPLAALCPEAPEGLVVVLARMMAKRPEDRYQTPGEVARALTGFAEPASLESP